MLPDRVSNPGPLTYESGALPIALRGPAYFFLKPVHTRLNKRPSVFLSSFFHFLIVYGHIHIRGPPKSFGELGRIAIYFQTAIIFRELGNKPEISGAVSKIRT